ncbi:MAG: hypothetical protein Q4A00_02660 [Flavobacteriaceae bacterium]|nr:hypothetical protein [Flavobacteriaceae bacterium]
MKSLAIVGSILLAISGALFYTTTDFLVEKFKMSHIMGIMGGIGIGLIIGGIVGYISKGTAIKHEKTKQKIAELQNEKYKLQQQINQQEENI